MLLTALRSRSRGFLVFGVVVLFGLWPGDVMDTVRIFDTTLRDGEQSPGATLTRPEKVEIARHLELMGVDIIEAGFPIASDGDFESVRAIAAEIKSSVICGL